MNTTKLFGGGKSNDAMKTRRLLGYILFNTPGLLWMTAMTLAKDRLVFGKDDALFGTIEKQQGGRPFGSVLDAGTGLHSLRWIGTLGEKGMTEFTAITADKQMQQNVQQEADAIGISELGSIVIGNWFSDTSPLRLGQQYDTILADYLIGAMDGFSPYKQDLIISKLTSYLRPGGRLYIVGLEPIPDSAPGDGDIICNVRRIRDACILLAGHRCYREYPVEWIHRQIEGNAQLELLNTTNFPILYRHGTIVNQINVGRSKLQYFPSPELGEEMKRVLDDLERRSLEATKRAGRIRLGFDYVVTAERVEEISLE
eukprot:scaffold22766_cov131-Cylindrotheca_fusiformis.AAC.6